MDQEELLTRYLEKLQLLCLERLEEERGLSIIEALKESIRYLEGEMQGY